jgi:hypothetical protein
MNFATFLSINFLFFFVTVLYGLDVRDILVGRTLASKEWKVDKGP